jgi:hypothetical protein
MLDAYMETRTQITYRGPTNFTPFLQQFKQMVQGDLSQGIRKYHVLLILTDGAISDFS